MDDRVLYLDAEHDRLGACVIRLPRRGGGSEYRGTNAGVLAPAVAGEQDAAAAAGGEGNGGKAASPGIWGRREGFGPGAREWDP
jgi:hypothetical protein